MQRQLIPGQVFCFILHVNSLISPLHFNMPRLQTNRTMDTSIFLMASRLIYDFISDIPFPRAFPPTAKKILTRLFRVFVHVYIHHFDKIQSLGAVSTFSEFLGHGFIMSLCLLYKRYRQAIGEKSLYVSYRKPTVNQ